MLNALSLGCIAGLAVMLVSVAYTYWRKRLYALGLLVGLVGSMLGALIIAVLTR